MMHRFSQILSRPGRRKSVDGVEGVGSASIETLRHDASPRQVKEKQRTCSQVNKTSGDVSRTEPATAAVAECPPTVEYGVAIFGEESCVHSNANNADAGGWATTSVTEYRNGNVDVNVFVDKCPSNNDLDSDATTGQEDIGVVGVNSFGGESIGELGHANLYRWLSVDLAYDADIDETPCADEQMTCSGKDFDQTVSIRAHAGSGPDTDETYSVEGKPSVDFVGANVVGSDVVGSDVVGANVVGADVVGANVVGADVVGDKPRGVSDVPRSDRESSVHPNANNANLERWETPYNSDTDPWDDDSCDEPEANVDLDSNIAIDQEDGGTAVATSVGEGPSPNQLEVPSNLSGSLLFVDLEYAGQIPCAYDGQTTVFNIGVSDVIYVPGLKSEDVDTAGGNPGGVDAVSRESELTSVSQVSADQYSANDDWGPAFVDDHEPLEDIGESDQRVLQKSNASGVNFGKRSSVQANVVGVNEKQSGVQSNIVGVNERLCIHSNAVDVNAKLYASSYVFNIDKLPSDQSRTTTPHTYTTVFISDAETDYEDLAADAVPTSTSAVNELPDECSRFAANMDVEEKVDPVETVDLTTATVKAASAFGGDLPDVKVEKVQPERVRFGAALVGANVDDWALPVVDDDPVTWVKSGDDFDWDDASSDTKPPYRLVCGCFPKRRRRLTIQLRRYRVKRVAKKEKKGEEVRAEPEPKDENFVEIKCPRGQSSFKKLFRSR